MPISAHVSCDDAVVAIKEKHRCHTASGERDAGLVRVSSSNVSNADAALNGDVARSGVVERDHVACCHHSVGNDDLAASADANEAACIARRERVGRRFVRA